MKRNKDNENYKNDSINNNNYKYYDNNARIFLKNLSNELNKVKDDPVETEKINFTINGKELCPEAKLVYEKIRILNYFAHQYEATIDFAKFNRLRNLLENAIECIDSKNYDYDVIAQIFVHIELELGMNVLLTTALLKLAKSEYINEKHYTRIDKSDYEELYNCYYISSHNKGGRRR